MKRLVCDPVPLGELPPGKMVHRDQSDSFGAIVLHEFDGVAHVLVCQGYRGISFPKGRPEPGETPEQTARREIFEETGVPVTIDTDFQALVPSARPGDRRTVTFFLGRCHGEQTRPQCSEVRFALWMPVRQAAAAMGYPPDRQALLAAAEYAALYASGAK